MAGNESSTNASVLDGANCTYSTQTLNYQAVAGIRATGGVVSAVCCLGVIYMILLFRKCKFYKQRMILLLVVAAFIHSLSYPLARVNYYTPVYLFERYCYFGGFFNMYSSWVEVIALLCLTFNIFMNVVLDRWTERLEYPNIVLTFFAPLLWCWIPFVKDGYGWDKAYCTIRTIQEDCSDYPFGQIVVYSMYYGPLFLLLLIMFLMTLVAAIKIRKSIHKWYGTFDPETKWRGEKLREEVKPLLWYPIIYLCFNVFSLVNQIDRTVHPMHPIIAFWYLHTLTSPFRGAFLALAYALDPETRSRLKWQTCKGMCVSLCSKKSQPQDYEVIYPDVSDSMRVQSQEVASDSYSKYHVWDKGSHSSLIHASINN